MPAPDRSPHADGGAPSHHLIVPFAVCHDDAWLPAMKALPPAATRHLQSLLRGMKPIRQDMQPADSLSPPHERAAAVALGLAGPAEPADGLIPWAARQAQAQLPDAARADARQRAWGWVTPCHWAMGREHATLTDPAALGLDEPEAHALLSAMAPYFTEDGITLHALQPGRWLAEGELFRTLPTASLDRVMGRNVDPWLPAVASRTGGAESPAARSARSPVQGAQAVPNEARIVKRLQNEMQMLLYTHPVNDSRASRRQLPVNSFWLSGTGALPVEAAAISETDVSQPRDLAHAALAGDWASYAQAWAALDSAAVKDLLAHQRAGRCVRITLCGERGFKSWESRPSGVLQKALAWTGFDGLSSRSRLWDELSQL